MYSEILDYHNIDQASQEGMDDSGDMQGMNGGQ